MAASFTIYEGDCIEKMQSIPDGSVDLVLCDPPYGTTACVWDDVIPFAAMRAQLLRIGKPLSSFVFTSSQPFTSALGASNLSLLKYALVWEKNRATGHVHAKHKPMKKHEDILVFSRGTTVHKTQSKRRMTYNPQGLVERDTPALRRENGKGDDTVLAKRKSHKDTYRTHDGYPDSMLRYAIPQGTDRVHPTQKPVELMEYLVRTYSNAGDTILDFTMGSGSTGVAALQANRNFVGIEKDADYFEIAKQRLEGVSV